MRYLLGAALIVASGAACAQQEPWQEYDKFIKSAQVIQAAGPELFGDSVNLYTGATTFSATDVSLPGNQPLPVQLGRSFAPMNDHRNRPFGDWDWDVPYIGGTFGHDLGWILAVPGTPGSANRCSAATSLASARPPRGKVETDGQGGVLPSWEYWSGYQLVTSSGGQEVLFATSDSKPKPTDGKTYPWVTKQFWYLSCLPSLRSGQPGEGFLAVSPDGTRYRFDWMVVRPTLELLKPVMLEGRPTNRRFMRDDIRLYPSRVEDRFGNWVDYQWTGGRLDRIVASDGRQLNLTWESDGAGGERIAKVATASTPVREWRYGYSQYQQLASVTLPDNSSWSLNLGSLWGNPAYDPAQEPGSLGGLVHKQDKALTCSWMRALLPEVRTASIRHPSGAVADFEFRTVRHGRNFVMSECVVPPDISPRPQPDPVVAEESYFSKIPARFDVLAMQSKRISGPGLPGYQWNYSYVTPTGGWWDNCPNCSTTKTTAITAPDGVRTVYTYGVVFEDNDGQLLKTEIFSQSGLVRSSQNSYISNAEAPSQAFSDRVGISPQERLDSFSSERLRPSKSSSTVQDGVTFTSTVNGFDAFSRPLSVTESNTAGYSKTDTTEYYDQSALWVTGQVRKKTNSNTGLVEIENDYDANTALPILSYAFGKLKSSLVYHPDGTIASVTDERNLAVRLDDWKRGQPQTIRFQDGTSKRVAVDDNGWIGSVTDENGFVTSYAYDTMGRMNRIVQPGNDEVNWAETTLSFEPVAAVEYGIAAGHWRQSVITGNRQKIVYFDALLRPVVETDVDAADPQGTARWTMKCYDHEGRNTFTSYPRNPYVDGWRNFDCAGVGQ